MRRQRPIGVCVVKARARCACAMLPGRVWVGVSQRRHRPSRFRVSGAGFLHTATSAGCWSSIIAAPWSECFRGCSFPSLRGGIGPGRRSSTQPSCGASIHSVGVRSVVLVARRRQILLRHFTVVATAIVGLLSAPFAVGSSPLPRLLYVDGTNEFGVRPATMTFGNGGYFITGPGVSAQSFRTRHYGHIRWRSWTMSEASGTGILWINSCRPDCAASNYSSRPVSIRASAPLPAHFLNLLLVYRLKGRTRHDHRGLTSDPTAPDHGFTWSPARHCSGTACGPLFT